jgi:hypothetical protein
MSCFRQNVISLTIRAVNLKIRIYKTVILPVFVYECKTRSLTLGEGHRLKVFDSRKLRIMTRLKRDEMTGD